MSTRTIGNAERGLRAIRPANRARLEEALHWETGSLTVAYQTGRMPGRATVPEDTGGSDPVLMEILRANLSDGDRVSLIELRQRQITDLRAEIQRREIERRSRRAG
jgi:hypothetical protein